MSALPPKADMTQHGCDVRFVPKADITTSLDHLVGAAEQRRWNLDAERVGSRHIDDELKRGRTQDRIGGLYALEDASNVGAHLPKGLRDAGAIAHQATDFRELTCGKRCRNRVARRQRGQLDPSAEKELVGADQQRPALTATSAAARTTAVRAVVTQNERKRSRRRYSPSIPIRLCRAHPNLLCVHSRCAAKPLDNLNQKVTVSHSSYDSSGTTRRSRTWPSNPRHVRDCRASLRLSGWSGILKR